MKKTHIFFLPNGMYCFGKSQEIQTTLIKLTEKYSTVQELLEAFQQGLGVQQDPR